LHLLTSSPIAFQPPIAIGRTKHNWLQPIEFAYMARVCSFSSCHIKAQRETYNVSDWLLIMIVEIKNYCPRWTVLAALCA
jgi:hypothetical protein